MCRYARNRVLYCESKDWEDDIQRCPPALGYVLFVPWATAIVVSFIFYAQQREGVCAPASPCNGGDVCMTMVDETGMASRVYAADFVQESLFRRTAANATCFATPVQAAYTLDAWPVVLTLSVLGPLLLTLPLADAVWRLGSVPRRASCASAIRRLGMAGAYCMIGSMVVLVGVAVIYGCIYSAYGTCMALVAPEAGISMGLHVQFSPDGGQAQTLPFAQGSTTPTALPAPCRSGNGSVTTWTPSGVFAVGLAALTVFALFVVASSWTALRQDDAMRHLAFLRQLQRDISLSRRHVALPPLPLSPPDPTPVGAHDPLSASLTESSSVASTTYS